MVQIPRTVWQAIVRLQEHRVCNMLNPREVARYAALWGHFQASHWILAHPGLYELGLTCGFEPIDPPGVYGQPNFTKTSQTSPVSRKSKSD